MTLGKLTDKITRGILRGFVKGYATKELVLDIGCGKSLYADNFPNRIGMDITKYEGVEIIADAHTLPFKGGCLKFILCTEVLEHLKNPQQAINEMRRILKPEGEMVLTTRFIFPLHEVPHDYYRFTKYGLKYLLRDWKIIDIKEETDTMGSFAVLIQRIPMQCDILNFKPFKILFHIMAHIIKRLGFVITKEYYKKTPEKPIMTSGYYVVAKKS